MDPLKVMGAVRIRVQTADKNITIYHNNKSCVFVTNKNIIKTRGVMSFHALSCRLRFLSQVDFECSLQNT